LLPGKPVVRDKEEYRSMESDVISTIREMKKKETMERKNEYLEKTQIKSDFECETRAFIHNRNILDFPDHFTLESIGESMKIRSELLSQKKG
jgi:hypothetical protein